MSGEALCFRCRPTGVGQASAGAPGLHLATKLLRFLNLFLYATEKTRSEISQKFRSNQGEARKRLCKGFGEALARLVRGSGITPHYVQTRKTFANWGG